MKTTLKIKTTKDLAGNDRVPPEVMRLLMALADHRNLCSQCMTYMKFNQGDYCATGRELVLELQKQPEVTFE